jgi:hypothetical protein
MYIIHTKQRLLASLLSYPAHFPVTSLQLFPYARCISTTAFTSKIHAMAVAPYFDRLPVCVEAQAPRMLKEIEKLEHRNGDLNNTTAMRDVLKPHRDPRFAHRSLAIHPSKDDPLVRSRYRPFLLPEGIQQEDWISRLELATATELAHNEIELRGERLRVLVLYGSLRQR